jgi:hypothetical protein
MKVPGLTPDIVKTILAGQHKGGEPDLWVPHQCLFEHRHAEPSPPFHASIVETFHSSDPGWVYLCFRNSGKSTISEEGFILRAVLRLFWQCPGARLQSTARGRASRSWKRASPVARFCCIGPNFVRHESNVVCIRKSRHARRSIRHLGVAPTCVSALGQLSEISGQCVLVPQFAFTIPMRA